MKKKIFCILLAAVMCVVLAACSAKPGSPTPAPDPAPQTEPAAPAPTEPQPESPVLPPDPPSTQEPAPTPAPDPAPIQDKEPAQESPQPTEPALPEPDETPDASSVSLVGTWRNDGPGSMSNGRCFLEISSGDGVNYSIDIWWGSSAASTAHWQYTGIYDETQQGIVYTGTHCYETTQADGSVQKDIELEDASGVLRLEDGVLIWEDTVEYTNDDIRFNYEG